MLGLDKSRLRPLEEMPAIDYLNIFSAKKMTDLFRDMYSIVIIPIICSFYAVAVALKCCTVYTTYTL